VIDQILTGKTAVYRAASEAIHRDTGTRHADNFRMMWACGLADSIRNDFYGLLALPDGARGALLDAGCGTGIETTNFQRRAPGLKVVGVDVSSVVVKVACERPDRGDALFYQAALERLPFGNDAFDYISSHEVIEHVEEPAPVLRELARVLKPGGVCAIATPNGASWWIDHLRQRVMRALGRRGAPVGADHTRPPSFWRREFAAAGFAIERQLFDGAAVEFLLFVAPERWMPALTALYEPLRFVPLVNLWLCDRVKFRLRKSGTPNPVSTSIAPCCPVCHHALTEAGSVATCETGHRFNRSMDGIIDFTVLVPDVATVTAGTGGSPFTAPHRRRGVQRLRRTALLMLSVLYGCFLFALLPLALVRSAAHRGQPLGAEKAR
jgi:2-polyprenyl-3-methyl-5-hydroxy-6-metoxy-1,4-benzoquinol methylase